MLDRHHWEKQHAFQMARMCTCSPGTPCPRPPALKQQGETVTSVVVCHSFLVLLISKLRGRTVEKPPTHRRVSLSFHALFVWERFPLPHSAALGISRFTSSETKAAGRRALDPVSTSVLGGASYAIVPGPCLMGLMQALTEITHEVPNQC